MNGPRVTAESAVRMTKSSEKAKRAVEDRLLSAVENNVETSAKQGRTFLFHTVPMYQFGVPLYDCSAMVRAIGRRLVRRGFRVKQVGVNHLYVEWGVPKKQPAHASPPSRGDSDGLTGAGGKKVRARGRAIHRRGEANGSVPPSTKDAIRRLSLNLRNLGRPVG